MFNIYKLTHRLTQEIYIGATSNLRRRMQARFNAAKGPEAEIFGGNLKCWDAEVLHIAWSAEEAAQVEAQEIAKVPAHRRLSILAAAGSGLRDDAARESFPHELGPVRLDELTHRRGAATDDRFRAAQQRRRAMYR